MTEKLLNTLAAGWVAARHGTGETQGLTKVCPGAGTADAYSLQARTRELELARGQTAAGWKIAFTADAIRSKFGLAEPAYGYMLASDLHPSGFRMPAKSFAGVLLEPEIAFRLGRDLDMEAPAPADVLAATQGLCPAYELVHGRVRSDGFSLVDMIADNASFGGAVLAGDWTAPDVLDLSRVTVSVYEGGSKLAQGSGAGVMGSPVHAVLWLARTLRQTGSCLRAGDVVISGSLTPQLPAKSGSRYTARFSGLGEVRVVAL